MPTAGCSRCEAVPAGGVEPLADRIYGTARIAVAPAGIMTILSPHVTINEPRRRMYGPFLVTGGRGRQPANPGANAVRLGSRGSSAGAHRDDRRSGRGRPARCYPRPRSPTHGVEDESADCHDHQGRRGVREAFSRRSWHHRRTRRLPPAAPATATTRKPAISDLREVDGRDGPGRLHRSERGPDATDGSVVGGTRHQIARCCKYDNSIN